MKIFIDKNKTTLDECVELSSVLSLHPGYICLRVESPFEVATKYEKWLRGGYFRHSKLAYNDKEIKDEPGVFFGHGDRNGQSIEGIYITDFNYKSRTNEFDCEVFYS